MSGRDLFEELAHTIVEAGLKPAGWAGGLKTQGRLNVAVMSLKAVWRQISLFLGGTLVFSQDLKLIGRGPPTLQRIIYINVC